MDTGHKAAVDPSIRAIETIRASMPGVYAAIKAKGDEIGKEAFALVRRGARGESDCFYAFEGGRVVGTPFCQAVMADVAVQMVEFGGTYLVVWPVKGGGDGAH